MFFSTSYFCSSSKTYELPCGLHGRKRRTQKTLELEGFPAACLQHEVDHLDGILYIDKVGSAFRSMLMKKVMKVEKAIRKKKEQARLEFEREHREIYGVPKTKTTSSKKRNKVRKKRPRRSKKK